MDVTFPTKRAPAHRFCFSQRSLARGVWCAFALSLIGAFNPVCSSEISPSARLDLALPTSGSQHTSSRSSGVANVAYDGVARQAFAEWLNDKPDDETLRDSASHLTEAQLRQSFYDMATMSAERSPDVMQARAQAQAAGYDVDTARGQRLPQLSLGAQTRAKAFGGQLASNDPSRSDSVSLTMQTNVFDWGATRKTIQSNQQLSQAAEQGYRLALENNALDVSTTVLELGRYRTITALGDAYVARMQTLVDMLAQIAAADQGRRSEWVQAKAQLLSAITNRDVSATQMRNYELKLRILLDGQRADIPSGGRWPIGLGDMRGLIADFRQNPAIVQAQATASAADLHVDALKASVKPRVDWLVNKSAFRAGPTLQRPWETSLQVSWPLFTGGSNTATRRAAMARAEASHQQVQSLARNYEFQVRDAQLNARDAFARADAYSDLVNETLLVRKAMFEQWYQLGKRSLLDVLLSETDHYNDQVGEVSSRFDGYEAVFSAYAGAGKLLDWLHADR